ncbi:MAG: LON peptidase substrate-binding domain-containing protein [Acidobacteria bacterium]|nr:LON peptidase substrate-binding domain-containing protein [Acidobacteriota bacterium]
MTESKLSLPRVLPIFPLTGTLLLPANWLPLHIFEPRYRSMVADAMAGDRIIGMIQPVVPRQDNRPAPGSESELPELYTVGCAGRIDQCRSLAGGRYAIALVGVSRFRVVSELPLEKGYRRAEVDYEGFEDDFHLVMDDGGEGTQETLLVALKAFGERQGFEFELDKLRELPLTALINGLAMALPFGPAEKQALLEADLLRRGEILLTLLEMGVDLEQVLEPRSPVPN